MKKLLIIAIAALLFSLGLLLPAISRATPTFPAQMAISKSGMWLQNDTEASWFTWNSNLYYIYDDRDLAATHSQMKIVQVTLTNGKITGQTDIATFGSGYGCMDALVDSGTLYVVATNCKMDFTHQGNSVVMFSSTNLTTWSAPTTLYTVEPSGQIYNVSIQKTGTSYTIGYEIHNPSWYSQYFLIRFLSASTVTGSWSDVGVTHTLLDHSCPDLQYVNGRYYIFTGHGPSAVSSYTTSLTSAWTTSAAPTIKPVYEYDSTYTSDPDVIEFNGTTYILYAAGDQSTFERLTYATFNGSLSQLIDAVQQPN